MKHTRKFFHEHVLDGKSIWTKYASSMYFVFAYPNGWGTPEMAFLRNAAIEAGYSPAQDAYSRIRFVTEAEASVHYCLIYTALDNILSPEVEFVVCDAGGSTVDTTVYNVAAKEPFLRLEERKSSACLQAGGLFIDRAAEDYLRRVLMQADLEEETFEDYVKTAVEEFELVVKRQFSDPLKPLRVSIADKGFNRPEIGVRRGIVTLPG